MLKKIRPRTLIVLGLFAMAIRATIQSFVDRLHHQNDFTDIALGALMGIGMGLTLLGLWRSKHVRVPQCALLILLIVVASACSVAPHPVSIPMNGQTIFVDDGGDGKGIPIFFVHGNGGNSEQWRAQLDSFRREGHRALAIDLPGFGKSTPSTTGDYSLTAMTDAIDRVATELRLKRFVIVGHSYAGAVVAQYAASHPEKVAGVVYLDAAAVAVPMNAEQQAKFTAALRANRMQVVHAWFAPILKPSSDAVREAVFASVEKSSTDAFVGALNSLTAWKPQELVNAYHGPRVAIVATDLETPASFQKQFPDVPAVRIAAAGHWIMLDKPDEVTAAIETFVSALR